MGYTKKVWEEKQQLDLLGYELYKRLHNGKPFGSGGEREYIRSMQKLEKFIQKEDNLAIVRILNKALEELIDIAKNTWTEEWK